MEVDPERRLTFETVCSIVSLVATALLVVFLLAPR